MNLKLEKWLKEYKPKNYSIVNNGLRSSFHQMDNLPEIWREKLGELKCQKESKHQL